jgi:hypothetical protein
MKKKAEILTVLFMVLSLWTGSLRAELITIYLTAEVTALDDRDNLLESKVSIGDIITGSYSYGSDTLDTNPLDEAGEYWHYSPPYGISLNVGGFVFQTDPQNVDFLVAVVNDHLNEYDLYLLQSYINLPLTNGVHVGYISWQLDDYSATALSSVALPTTPPVLGDWEFNNLNIVLGQYASVVMHARVTNAVPEPATVLLLALGSLIIARRRR